MARLGMDSKSTSKTVADHSKATVNKAGGLAFNFDSPAEYLIATVGASMFTEPNYYADTEKPEDIKIAGFNTAGLDEQATKIINACILIAGGDNPRDVLAIANWVRSELNIRTTPMIMTAVAAKCEGTKPFIKNYVPRVAQRPDDILQIFAAFGHLFRMRRVETSSTGRKIITHAAIPASLKKGLAAAMSNVGEYGYMKYGNGGHPNWKDLLPVVHRKKNYPVSKAMYEYLMNGVVIDEKATPILAARKKLTSTKKWSRDLLPLVSKAKVTWEVLISQFGSKREVWEAVVPMMGYMALMRNLANFLDAGIDPRTATRIAAILTNPERVAKSRQLPFRFLSAHTMLTRPQVHSYMMQQAQGVKAYRSKRDPSKWNHGVLNIFADALEGALDQSITNMPVLPGVTAVLVDESGSMSSKVSGKSIISCRDAANALASMVHASTEQSYMWPFGGTTKLLRLSKRDSVITNVNKLANSNVGHATHAHLPLDQMIKQGIKVDRIILLSDMQCYGRSTYMGWGMASSGGDSVAKSMTRYRNQINNKCFLHSFDLRGQGTQQDAPNKLTNVVAGYSEKIFSQVAIFEGEDSMRAVSQGVDVPELPTLEWIRENY